MSVCVSVWLCVCKSLTSTSLVYYLTSVGFRPLSLLVSGAAVAVVVVVGAGSAHVCHAGGDGKPTPLSLRGDTHMDRGRDSGTDRQQ